MNFESLDRFLAVLSEFMSSHSICGSSMWSFLSFIQELRKERHALWSALFEPKEITDPLMRHQRLTWCVRQLFELYVVSERLQGHSRFRADWQEPLNLWQEDYGEYDYYIPAGLTLSAFRHIIGGSPVSVKYIASNLYLPEKEAEVQFEQMTTRAGVISLKQDPFLKNDWFHPADRRTTPLALTLEELLWVLRYRLTNLKDIYPKQVACRNSLLDESSDKVLALALPEYPDTTKPQVTRLRFVSVKRTDYSLSFPFGEFVPITPSS